MKKAGADNLVEIRRKEITESIDKERRRFTNHGLQNGDIPVVGKTCFEVAEQTVEELKRQEDAVRVGFAAMEKQIKDSIDFHEQRIEELKKLILS